MTMYDIAEIAVENLLLDLENPRHDVLQDQQSALNQMMIDQEKKLVNLARDIIKEGINPSELPIVMPWELDRSKYIVLEGNRRVVVIKLLLNPELAQTRQKPSLEKQFKDFAQEFAKARIDKLKCIVVEQREDADHWIQLRHTGENDGVGVVGWDTEAVTRFNKRIGRSDFNTLAVQVMQFLRKDPDIDETLKARLGGVSVTNLARLINDPDFRKTLGFRVSNGEIETDLPKSEVVKGLTKVIDDLAGGHVNVTGIYYKADRLKYLETFDPQNTPDFKTTTGKPWKLVSGTSTATSPAAAKGATKSGRAIPLSTSRKTLIPPNTRLRIGHYRLNQIYHELRRLEVDRFPNCAAVLLRVFLEMSVDEFASRHTVSSYSPNSKLFQKLQVVANHMEKNGILAKDQLKEVRVASTSPNMLFSTNTLNAYVHNKDYAPKPSELKTAWDNMQRFIEKLWE
jgi:hypothetical protein